MNYDSVFVSIASWISWISILKCHAQWILFLALLHISNIQTPKLNSLPIERTFDCSIFIHRPTLLFHPKLIHMNRHNEFKVNVLNIEYNLCILKKKWEKHNGKGNLLMNYLRLGLTVLRIIFSFCTSDDSKENRTGYMFVNVWLL